MWQNCCYHDAQAFTPSYFTLWHLPSWEGGPWQESRALWLEFHRWPPSLQPCQPRFTKYWSSFAFMKRRAHKSFSQFSTQITSRYLAISVVCNTKIQINLEKNLLPYLSAARIGTTEPLHITVQQSRKAARGAPTIKTAQGILLRLLNWFHVHTKMDF